jgi:hypothetical protein
VPQLIVGVAASGDDGWVEREGAEGEWPPTSGFTVITNTSSDFGATTRKLRNTSIGFTAITVSLFKFDTSALPDSATVTAAVLRLSNTGVATSEARALNFEYYDFGASIGTEDWVADVGVTAAQVAAATWQAWATSGTVDVTLTGLSNISKTGTTGIRVGIDGTGAPPSGLPDEDTRIHFAEFDHATRDEAKLVIDYTDGSGVLVQPPIRRVF